MWDVCQHGVIILSVFDLLDNLHVLEVATAALVVGAVARALADGFTRVAGERAFDCDDVINTARTSA